MCCSRLGFHQPELQICEKKGAIITTHGMQSIIYFFNFLPAILFMYLQRIFKMLYVSNVKRYTFCDIANLKYVFQALRRPNPEFA